MSTDQQTPSGRPTVPQHVISLIAAYGDARADFEAGAKIDTATPLGNCVQAIRKLLAFPAPAEGDAPLSGLPMVIAGALYDFAGWLTSRSETLTAGATEMAGPMADALVEWAKLRGLSLDDPAILSWQELITQPNVQPKGTPVAWTLRKTLDKAETTTTGYLWFTDPENSAWAPLYAEPQQQAWVWNPASLAWEAVQTPWHRHSGALYAYGPTPPDPLAAPSPAPVAWTGEQIDALMPPPAEASEPIMKAPGYRSAQRGEYERVGDTPDYWTREQVHAVVRAALATQAPAVGAGARAAALEEAAIQCEAVKAEFERMAQGANTGMYDHQAQGAETCAEAIRSFAAIGGK